MREIERERESLCETESVREIVRKKERGQRERERERETKTKTQHT